MPSYLEKVFRESIVDVILDCHELPGDSEINDAVSNCSLGEMSSNNVGAAICRAACEGTGLLIENLMHTTNKDFGYGDRDPETHRLDLIHNHISELKFFLTDIAKRYAR